MNLTGDLAVGVSQECDDIPDKIQPCRSSTIIAAWAVGGNVRHQLYCMATVFSTITLFCITS